MTTYYTKDQAERIMADWGIAQPLPRKGMQVGVQWAGGETTESLYDYGGGVEVYLWEDAVSV